MVVKTHCTGDENVVAGVAHNVICTYATGDHIVNWTSRQKVDAGAAEQQIITSSALEVVIAIATIQPRRKAGVVVRFEIVVAGQIVNHIAGFPLQRFYKLLVIIPLAKWFHIAVAQEERQIEPSGPASLIKKFDRTFRHVLGHHRITD